MDLQYPAARTWNEIQDCRRIRWPSVYGLAAAGAWAERAGRDRECSADDLSGEHLGSCCRADRCRRARARHGRAPRCDALDHAVPLDGRAAPIAVLSCELVDPDFHARFSCVARHYEYRIVNRRAPLSLDAGKAWRIAAALDAEKMHDSAQALVGRHDFTTFRSAHCQAESPQRTLDRLDVTRLGDRVSIFASARSFLHHQVRSMVGCLAMVGEGKWTADDLKASLDARDRHALGFNAPPDGLYFVRADY